MHTYEFVSYNIPEYTEMRAALDARDFDLYFKKAEKLDAAIDKISRELMSFAEIRGCVMLDMHGIGINDSIYARRGYRRYLHKSTRYHGCMQLTSWDCFGPIGDVKISSADSLAEELRHSVRDKLWCMIA